MSDAGDDIQVDAPAVEAEVTTDTVPKGKLSVEEALQVRADTP
jgi:small subunit ribosomal protein S12e